MLNILLDTVASGPSFTLANGDLIPCLERCISYAFDAVSKIQSEGIKLLSPKPEAVDEFQEHKDCVMNDLVWKSGCRSWYVPFTSFPAHSTTPLNPYISIANYKTDCSFFRYKNGKVDGKISSSWPGSSVHFLELMSNPRWEDWNIKYLSPNRFAFLGNGRTEREENGDDLG